MAPTWKSLGVAALSGLLLAGALPALDWGWLAWIGLVPFLRLFPFRSARAAFWHGGVLGVCYLGVMAYWVAAFARPLIGGPLSGLGWALVTAYQSFYLAVWALGAQRLRGRPSPWAFRLGVPALWAVVEWWRQWGTTGLGWGDLAYTQHLALPVLQMVKLTGIWGLAFLIVLVNAAVAEVFTPSHARGEARRSLAFPALAAACLVAALVYGVAAIRAENLRPTFVAAALQGNIDQNVPQDTAYVERVLRTFTTQASQAAARGAKLSVWPETAYPGALRGDPWRRARVAAEAARDGQALLIGSVEADASSGKNANALLMLTPTGDITGSYRKRQLVPFGEYVPFRRAMPWLEALHVTVFDMKAGGDRQALLDGGPGVGKIGATICFESSYPRFLREQVARGAGLLVISTDDTWFGRTAAPRQHSAIAAVRAAESDRYLVRSAATGVSQVIDPTGRVLAEADLFKPAVVSAPVESRATRTPYVRWGDWFVGFCALLVTGVGALPGRKGGS